MQSEFPNVIEINHILKNQIYGISLSQEEIEFIEASIAQMT